MGEESILCNVKDIMASLSDEDRRTLMMAFENQISKMIKLPGIFIGVNIIESGNIVVDTRVGCWCIGRILEEYYE